MVFAQNFHEFIHRLKSHPKYGADTTLSSMPPTSISSVLIGKNALPPSTVQTQPPEYSEKEIQPGDVGRSKNNSKVP